MWDTDKMDEEKKAKWMAEFKELGIAEDKIDGKLVWTVKKVNHKIMKLRFVLDELGIEEGKANEIARKVVAHALEVDLAEVKEWHMKHEEEHEHSDHDCCPHCHKCHHEGEGHHDHEEKKED